MSDKPKIVRVDPNFDKKRKNLIKPDLQNDRLSKGGQSKVLSTTKSQMRSELKFKERMNKSKEPSVEKRSESNTAKSLDKIKHNPSVATKKLSKTNIKVVESIPEQSDTKERESVINVKQKATDDQTKLDKNTDTGSGSKVSQINAVLANSK